MSLGVTEQMLIEQKISNNKKSTGAAYLLWFFLGGFGAHRFYLGAVPTAVIQLILFFTIIGWPVLIVWWIVDAFLIPGLIDAQQENLRKQYQLEAMVMRGDAAGA